MACTTYAAWGTVYVSLTLVGMSFASEGPKEGVIETIV
jgi:hypothetical protein